VIIRLEPPGRFRRADLGSLPRFCWVFEKALGAGVSFLDWLLCLREKGYRVMDGCKDVGGEWTGGGRDKCNKMKLPEDESKIPSGSVERIRLPLL
jgi:hypothetical protein